MGIGDDSSRFDPAHLSNSLPLRQPFMPASDPQELCRDLICCIIATVWVKVKNIIMGFSIESTGCMDLYSCWNS